VAAVTVQVLPSIIIEYNEVSVTKLVPVKVTEVPPVTVPYRGLTAVNNGVIEPEYDTVSVRLANISFPLSRAIAHVKVASELSTVSTPDIFNSATSQPLF
jgi:hypothetical protein